MPVIHIHTLPFAMKPDVASILIQLNTKVAEAIGLEPGHIWSYWTFIESHHYAAGSETAAITGSEKHSPIVTIKSFEGRTQEQITAMLNAAADVLSQNTGISRDNIFITYQEVLSGRVFDGGEVVFKK
jgi:phenylpyruvate tautomerase PptA (4-oxalocrotonate tautomerase family)